MNGGKKSPNLIDIQLHLLSALIVTLLHTTIHQLVLSLHILGISDVEMFHNAFSNFSIEIGNADLRHLDVFLELSQCSSHHHIQRPQYILE